MCASLRSWVSSFFVLSDDLRAVAKRGHVDIVGDQFRLYFLLNPGSAGEASVLLPVPKPVDAHRNSGDEPEEGVREKDPDGILHTFDAFVPLSVFLDVHLAENAEGRDPEDEHDGVPNPDVSDAQDEGNQVDKGRNRGDATDNDCVGL
jgi:hypothetical protein